MSIRKLSLLVLVVLFQVYVSGCSKSSGPKQRPEPNPVAPQLVSTYRITGSVVDPTGNPVENVKVSILTTTNASYTDVNGKYSFENVDVGTYTLAGEKAGYTYGEVNSIVTENGSATPTLILKDVREITGRKETESTGSDIKANGLSVLSTTTEQVSTGTGSVVAEQKEVKASIPSNTEITIGNKVVTSAITISAAPLQVDDLPPAPKNEMSMGAAVFEPQGATFSQPVSITVPMTMPLPAGVELPLKKYVNGQWQTVGTATVNASGTGADANVSEFGQLVVQPKISVNLTHDPKPQEVDAPPINVSAGQTNYVAQTTDAVTFPSGLPKGVSVEYATSLIEKMKSTKIGISKQVVIQNPLLQTKAAAKVAKIAGVQELWETEWTVVKKTVTNSETITITIDTANLAKRAALMEFVITYEYSNETWVPVIKARTVKWFIDVVVNGASGVTVTMTEEGGVSSVIGSLTAGTPFRFLGLTNINYTLVPKKEGFTFTPSSVEIRKLGNDVSYTFTAQQSINKIPISGTVTGADSVTVKLTGDLLDSQVVSTDGGSYNFSVDVNKNYTVTPSKVGYVFVPSNAAFSTISIPAMQNFVATRNTATISGTVNGAQGVKVTLKGETVNVEKDIVNAGDSYSFTGIPTGPSYTVSASKGSGNDIWIVTPGPQSFTNLSGDVTGVDFTVHKQQKKIRISGSVIGADGVTVTLTDGDLKTVTLNDGQNYSWEVDPGLDYTVSAQKSGVEFEQASVTYTNLQTDAGLVFRAIKNVTISGQLIHADKSAIIGAIVTLSGGALATTTTDASGNYSFSVRAGKQYTITPSMAGYSFSPSNYEANVTQSVTNDFIGTRWVTISGRVTGADGVKVTLRGSLSGSLVIDNGGTYSFKVMAGGTYYVSATKGSVAFSPAEITITNMQNDETHNINVNVQHNQGSIQ